MRKEEWGDERPPKGRKEIREERVRKGEEVWEKMKELMSLSDLSPNLSPSLSPSLSIDSSIIELWRTRDEDAYDGMDWRYVIGMLDRFVGSVKWMFERMAVEDVEWMEEMDRKDPTVPITSEERRARDLKLAEGEEMRRRAKRKKEKKERERDVEIETLKGVKKEKMDEAALEEEWQSEQRKKERKEWENEEEKEEEEEKEDGWIAQGSEEEEEFTEEELSDPGLSEFSLEGRKIILRERRMNERARREMKLG